MALSENTVWLLAFGLLTASLLALLALLGTIGARPLGWEYAFFALPAAAFAAATFFAIGWARLAAVEAVGPAGRSDATATDPAR